MKALQDELVYYKKKVHELEEKLRSNDRRDMKKDEININLKE